MSKYYDVIVVGAGPAGSTAAYLLSTFKLKVLLIDKFNFPRKKLCGGLLTFKTNKLISRIFNLSEKKIKSLINFSSKEFNLYYKDALLLKGKSKKPFNFIERYKYDSFFVKMAKQQGVEVLDGEEVTSFNPSLNEIATATQKKFKSKFIIGADGVNSVIRRKLQVLNLKDWNKNLAIAIETSVNDLKIKCPSIYLGFTDIGYGWAFPNKDKTIIGLGGLIGKRNFTNEFKHFMNQLGFNKNYNINGHLIPYGNFIESPIYKNTILVGDAAGFVDPILGEGIFFAHRSGEIAAWSIYYYLKEKLNLKSTYTELLKEYLLPQLRYAKRIRDILFRNSPMLQYFPFKLFLNLFQKQLLEVVHGIRLYNLRKWEKCYKPIQLHSFS